MTRARGSLSAALALAALVAASSASANEAGRCVGDPLEVPLASVEARAGVLANALKRDGSIRVVAARLLDEATAAARRARPPGEVCSEACPAAAPDVVLRSVPTAFRAADADAAHCQELLASTTEEPLVWERSFDDAQDLGDWIAAFSRGRGEDGRELYRLCDGACSPQYAWTIREAADGRLDVRADVVCGPPRDRDDDLYRVASGLVWTCGPS